ncbi:helix-turn-helix transcriptional regulator [Tamlana sp. 2201CG12-4]|uniref:helix-turn-helix domain-containing protein n=1 Tax=Tamlana sp. 2201CG12-4 TaxID=3112582 RepID=UPI002DBC2F3C|nr:helix-turn-helix transcriptional regulator [Tamlana sp. 2201CG12-4]MEC3908846.1 helix-turn-helix transcriptional regulator [Tamlana sp. 2201CG12-4]
MEDSLIELIHLSPLERLLSFIRILQKLTFFEDFELLASTSFSDNLSLKESGRINLIYDYVRKNHIKQIRLHEIAEKVSMSKEAFCRFFKKTFNKSFFEFVNEYKISLASKLLIGTDYSISQVGYEVGYNNLSFFHRQFNKFKGMSPSKYRQNYRRILKVS